MSEHKDIDDARRQAAGVGLWPILSLLDELRHWRDTAMGWHPETGHRLAVTKNLLVFLTYQLGTVSLDADPSEAMQARELAK